jgi:hypothetical protein
MPSFFKSCTDDQLIALKEVQKLSGVSLKDSNPFSESFSKTPSGKNIQMILEGKFPKVAAELKASCDDYTASLDAELFQRGHTELTNGVHQELMGADPVYQEQFQNNQRAEEERLLQKMEEEATAMAKRRGVDITDNQKFNPHLGGKFASYFENLNAEAALND